MFIDPNRSFVAVLTTAATTLNLPVSGDYVDMNAFTKPKPFNTYTNGITPITILSSPVATGSIVAGSFTIGTDYQILSIGTTDFTLIGATANTVGLIFTATGIGTGTGTAALSALRKINGLEIYNRDAAAKTLKIYEVDATPTTGLITAGAFVVGNDYQIVSVGTTNFTLIGASANTVGVIFTATGAGTGTGTASTCYQKQDVTLQIDDVLGYTDTGGWYVQDNNGNRKTITGVYPIASTIRVNTANGYGSTNTMIRRFSTIVTSQGSDITYADSATLGGSFTINTNGVYGISYTDEFSAQAAMGISLNTSQPTVQIYSITAADRLALTIAQAANITDSTATTVYLTAGSVIRAHGDSTTSSAFPVRGQFTITLVARTA